MDRPLQHSLLLLAPPKIWRRLDTGSFSNTNIKFHIMITLFPSVPLEFLFWPLWCNFDATCHLFSCLWWYLLKDRKNCECCHKSAFKGHNVIVHIVVLNCQKCNQCPKCQVSGNKSFQKFRKSEFFFKNLKSEIFLKIWQFSANLKCFTKICQNCQKLSKLSKLSKIVKIIKKFQKKSTIIKIVKIDKNC